MHKSPDADMKKHIGIIIALCVFAVQAVLVPKVGMSWDEPASFFIGRVNLKFWMTGNRQYLNDIKNKELYADSPFPYIYGEDIYPPFPFLVSSAVSYVFAEKLKLIGIYDAHHIGEVLIGSVGVWAMYGLALEAGLTVPIAVITTLMYTLYPSIWGPMRNDPKDLPLLAMLVTASYFFLRFLKAWQAKNYRSTWISGLLFAVTFGLAECSKPTAAVFVAYAGIWMILASVRSGEFRKKILPFGPFFAAILSMGIIAVLVFLFAWPWLWEDPVGRLNTVWSFFRTVGYNMPVLFFGQTYRAGISVPKIYPYAILLFQTPVLITILALTGTAWAIWNYVRKGMVLPFLFVIWFWVGISRFLLPNFIIYQYVRHFIDVMPAFFILAGYGIAAVVRGVARLDLRFNLPADKAGIKDLRIILNGLKLKQVVTGVIAVVIIGHEIIISVQFFPYETVYFNFLVGGTKAVSANSWSDIGYPSSIKESMEFIARDSKENPILVYPCAMGHVAMFYTTPNMKLIKATEYAKYTMVPNSPSWFGDALKINKALHETAYVVRRAGADLFYVFRYTQPIGSRCGWETVTTYEYQ
jgi:uncharacterized membrane protein